MGGFWHDFFEIFGQNAKKAENAQNACQTKTSITNVPRVGGRRCSPPGGFQSACHRRCANGVPDSFPTGSVESQLANLDILSRISI